MRTRTSSARFTGQLYQLSSRRQLSAGDYVAVNGPWDTYGQVIKSDLQPDGTHLNLIRGCREKSGTATVARF